MNENVQWEQNWDDAQADSTHYVLRLFITGASANSRRAVINLKDICEKYIKDNYSLEIVDVHQQKSIAAKEQLVALPLLIKISPSPERRLIGDLSDTVRVLKGLGISEK
jgi:circadian clock protein KaiB